TLDLPPAHGVVVDKNSKPAEGAIVYLTVSNNSILSGKTDKLGLWVIPFNNLRTGDFLSRPNLTDSDLIQITVKNSPEGVASAVIDLKSIKQNLAIPDMTIGNSYNFINLISKKDQLAKLNNQNILGAKTSVTNFPTMTKKPEKPPEIDILFPKNDRDFTPDKKPKLRGVARPGSQVLITVKSNPQTGKIKTAKDGTWSWVPPKNLEPGLHEITIQSYDSSGKLVTVTKTFYVLKSGESVLGDTTPSGDLITVTCAPSVCLPSPTTVPTTGPTVPSATPIPTNIPLPTPTDFPTEPPPPPPTNVAPRSGVTTPTNLMFAASATLLLLGAKLLLFP
ncbi:Ig-like domain-containing protein, partial [Candidatus Microgenomates bacterium]|nr:Ig-like domain-containing protein [Candidatus Microgenomates bacterium]